MARRIKIVSDGTAPGTKVYAVDPTGVDAPEPIQRVTGVEWKINGETGAAEMKVTVFAPEVDVVGDEPEEDEEREVG